MEKKYCIPKEHWEKLNETSLKITLSAAELNDDELKAAAEILNQFVHMYRYGE